MATLQPTGAREVRPAIPLTMHELVFPGDLNAGGVMFGGKVVAYMDICAGLCVTRWARRPAVTAAIDSIQFRAPIRQGQMVEISGRIVHVGNTSCMTHVSVHAHNHVTGDVGFTCEGYFTMVCLDEQGRPMPLPLIPLDTPEAQAAWNQAELIRAQLLARRKL